MARESEPAPETPPAAETVHYPTESGAARAGLLVRGGAHALVLAVGPGEPAGFWSRHLAALAGHGLTLLAPSPDAAPPADPEAAAAAAAAGAAFLRGAGAARVSILGAGGGATAAAEAVLSGRAASVHTLFLLAPGPLSGPVGHMVEAVVIVSADEDAAVPVAVEQRMLSPGNVQLTVYTGDHPAHALLDSPHGSRLMALIRSALPPDAA